MRDRPDIPVLSSAALRVLREDQPSARELAAAYRRYERKPQRRSPGLLVSRWLIAGLAMGLGVAFGAESVVERLRATQPARPSAQSTPPRATPQATRSQLPVPSPEDTPGPAVEAPPPASSGPMMPHVPSSANGKSAATEIDQPTLANDASVLLEGDRSPWTKAARGLRDNDFTKTEQALATLETAGSIADREAARLIRAQLMLHQGNASGARALLGDLASNAQSAQLRAKARGLLREPQKSNSLLKVAPSGT
jgi:hypothetical protein